MIHLALGAAVGIPALALVALWATKSPRGDVAFRPTHESTLLFRDGVLEHATPEALSALPLLPGLSGWEDLHAAVHEQFPDFPAEPGSQIPARQVQLAGVSDPSDPGRALWIDYQPGSVRVHLPDALANPSSEPVKEPMADHPADALANSLPYPAWHLNAADEVTWSNAAYETLRSRMVNAPETARTPIFGPAVGPSERVKIDVTGTDEAEWYSVESQETETGRFCHAVCQSALVRAEDARRDFVQTLAKTFAHLPIGLAIFSSDRRLVLFNPALTDLTGLDVMFLGPKPTLDSFFDAMRERRRMPEPKNYRTWRQRINDLVSAAEDDVFQETWTLENGQTLRVKGQPHPEGALAFLIEDISAEVSLTRNFRAELELGQSLLDTFDDALAVFSQAGIMTFSNKAYDLLWGFELAGSFADVTIGDAVQLWQEKTVSGPDWQALRNTVLTFGERRAFSLPIKPMHTAKMHCHVVPITAGATMVRFSAVTQPVASPEAVE